jgi:hypothetical protein
MNISLILWLSFPNSFVPVALQSVIKIENLEVRKIKNRREREREYDFLSG